MNGRAYDPELGRFLSVDPFITFPDDGQSLNPYSYVMNNPLKYTDPSGYSAKPRLTLKQRNSLKAMGASRATVSRSKSGATSVTAEISANTRLADVTFSFGSMLSIALTKTEHQVFTNAWRKAIPYGKGTADATKENVLRAAKQIYKEHSDILKALGLLRDLQ